MYKAVDIKGSRSFDMCHYKIDIKGNLLNSTDVLSCHINEESMVTLKNKHSKLKLIIYL